MSFPSTTVMSTSCLHEPNSSHLKGQEPVCFQVFLPDCFCATARVAKTRSPVILSRCSCGTKVSYRRKVRAGPNKDPLSCLFSFSVSFNSRSNLFSNYINEFSVGGSACRPCRDLDSLEEEQKVSLTRCWQRESSQKGKQSNGGCGERGGKKRVSFQQVETSPRSSVFTSREVWTETGVLFSYKTWISVQLSPIRIISKAFAFSW